MDWSIALIILATGLFAWFLLTGLRWAYLDRSSRPERDLRPSFHAVSIRMNGPGCASARSISRQRFLANEAPRLPLLECDRANCNCSYVHFDDRRRGERRLWAAVSDREERRARAEGRRIDDRLGYG
jgi:hypothetical protein